MGGKCGCGSSNMWQLEQHIIILKMALLLEFSDYLQTAERNNCLRNNSQRNSKFDASVVELVRALEMLEITPVLQTHHSKDGKFTLNFKVKSSCGVSSFYRVTFDQKSRRMELGMSVLLREQYVRLRSSQILKNTCRTLRSINSMACRALAFFAVNPRNCQLILKTHTKTTSHLEADNFFPYVRFLMADASNFLRSFSPILLHSCNLIPRTSLENQLLPSLKHQFFGPNGDFSRYAEVYELMPLVNCPLEVQKEATTDQEREENDQKNSNPKKIIQLLYDQKKNNEKKEIGLYCEPPAFNLEKPIFGFIKDARALTFPTLKEGSGDHPFIYNTINVTGCDKKREKYFGEGGKAKIIALPTKFKYAKSMDPNWEAMRAKKDGDLDEESTEEADDNDSTQENAVEMEKVLLVKMPRVQPKDKDWKKLLDQITYEKEVLSSLRTVGCAYIPKYYHSVQNKYQYHPFLLMDYVPGAPLAEEMEKKKESLTHSGKLQMLTHLSNALRFLNQRGIAHLDLSPNNVMVIKDFLVKLIDFGEAYHHPTSRKYSPYVRGQYGRFVYSPGRTFPYAPPETSSRLDNFSSQQDMYSLGVIMHELLFGTYPFHCSQETHKRLFLNKTYTERMMMAPERGELYGQADFIAILTNLTLKLLDCDEKMRPYPVWAHIIIKKLFYAVR